MLSRHKAFAFFFLLDYSLDCLVVVSCCCQCPSLMNFIYICLGKEKCRCLLCIFIFSVISLVLQFLVLALHLLLTCTSNSSILGISIEKISFLGSSSCLNVIGHA